MTIRTDATARGGPTEFISGCFQRDCRRVFDEIFSLSGEGRLTLEVLKEISAALLRFFKCRAAEIVYEEKHKVWHAKSIAGRRLATSGWKEKTVRKPDVLDALETAAPETLARLKSRIRAETRHGRSLSGVVALSFAHGLKADEAASEWLERLTAVVGRSLCHNLSRFELRERLKELTCMYNIANLAMTSDPNTDRFLQ